MLMRRALPTLMGNVEQIPGQPVGAQRQLYAASGPSPQPAGIIANCIAPGVTATDVIMEIVIPGDVIRYSDLSWSRRPRARHLMFGILFLHCRCHAAGHATAPRFADCADDF